MKRFILLNAAFCVSLLAAPEGFHLVQGDANPPVRNGAGNLVIETGKQAVIQWDSFSIAQHEAVQFIQHDAQSAVLNRVVGSSKSCIDGLLSSNGKIYLVNPNGVLIGPNGKIMTAGFVASTLDLLDEDFLKGTDFSFRGNSNQAIVNLGTIESSSGDIFLLGARIQNKGIVKALQGRVGFGVGSEILIQPQGKRAIYIKCPIQNTPDSDALIDQAGIVEAFSTEFQSNAQLYEKAICLSGTASAYSTKEEGGRVYLYAENGECKISGNIMAKQKDRGGEIVALGKTVIVEDGAQIDASGKLGGGNVFLGGGCRGVDPELPNAENTYIGASVQIFADAVESGNGGVVVAYSEEKTSFLGNIYARGGSFSGDGGMVEISGKYLDAFGIADRSAIQGKAGVLLFDPIDITISVAADNNVNDPGGAGTYTFPPGCGSTTSVINIFSLGSNLDLGDVIIDTSASGGAACGGTGNITVPNSINWNSSGSLTMIADGGMTISNTIENLGSGSVILQTNNGSLQMTNGTVNTEGSVSLSIAGDVTMSNSIATSARGFNAQGVTGTIAGNLSLTASASQAASVIGGRAGQISDGSISLTVGGGITITASSGSADAGIGYGVVSFSQPASFITDGNITVTANGGDIVLSGIGTTRIGHYNSTTTQGAVTIQSSGSISLTSSGEAGTTSTLGHLVDTGFSGSNPMLVIANDSITVTAGSGGGDGGARIQNLDSSSTLTLVCDNANATSYNPGSTAGLVFTGDNALLQFFFPVQELKLYSVDSSLNTLPSTIVTSPYPPPVGQESLYEESAVLYPGGTYGGQAYMNFYKIGYAPPSPPTPTPTPTPTPPTVDPIQVVTVSSSTSIANILTPPTNTSTNSVIQGPATQTDQNPNDAINQTPSYNNDYRTAPPCQ